MAIVESRVGSLITTIINPSSIGGNILRDAPTLPTEPDPADVTLVWFLSFRDGSPGLIWDNVNLGWI